MLFFRQDGKVGMVLGGRSYYIEGIKVDNALNWVEIMYPEGNAEYSFNLKPLSEQICRYACEISLREGEGRSSIGLKEELRRLLGYDAGVELEEGMGSRYGIIVSFDNGRKAYTGTNRLVITVPEGVSKIEWIKIVSIKERAPSLLHEIIEAGGDPKKVSHQTGEAGERIVILGYGEVNYQKDILAALSEKTGIPLNELEDYLKAKGAISYFAKRHMWGDEIAKRMSSKHGLEVRFEIDFESGFATSFDSTRMNDEQLIDEIMRRIDVIAEAREMFLSEELMNDFLKTGE